MKVSEVYTRRAIAVPQSTSLKDAARLMCAHDIGCLIVTDDPPAAHKAVGIITDRDVVVYALARGLHPDTACVGYVMSPQLARVAETADAQRAVETMAELGIRRVAVTRDSGEIVGVLSYDELVDALAAGLKALARVIRNERCREPTPTRR
jgi:CBS domain-containing protein